MPADGMLVVGTQVNLGPLKAGFSEAKAAVEQASKNMADAQLQFGKAAEQGSAQAAEALKFYQTELRSAQDALSSLSASEEAETRVLRTNISARMAASAELQILRGNLQSSTRAAGAFLSSLPGVGAAMQAAFAPFAVVALVGLLGEAAKAVGNVVKAFEDLDGAEIKATTDAILAGEKIIEIKASHFDLNAFARFAEGAPAQAAVTIQNASAKLKEIQQARELADALAANNEQGKIGVALQQQKIADAKADVEYAKEAEKQAQALVNSYKDLLEAKITVAEARTDPKSGMVYPAKQINAITDPQQVKAIQDQLRIAVGAAQDFNHEIDMMKAKLQGAELKMPLVDEKANAKLQTLVDEVARGWEKIADQQREIDDQSIKIHADLMWDSDLTNNEKVMEGIKASSKDLLDNLKQITEQYRLQDEAAIRAASAKFSSVEQRTQLSVDEGQIDPAQRIAILQQALAQEYAAQMAAIKKKESLDAGYKDRYQEDLDQEAAITQAYYQKQQQLAEQAVLAIEKRYQQAFSTIDQDFNRAVDQWLQGTQKFTTSFAKMADNMAISFINNILKMGEKWAQQEALNLIVHATTNASITASDAAAAATSKTLSAQSVLGQITHYAALAAAKAYSALAGIPIVGPELGAVAAATTFVAVEALAAFDKGTSYIPRDGMAMLHKGESVLPPPQTGELRDALGRGRGRSGHTVNLHYGPTFNGYEKSQMRDILDDQQDHILNMVQKGINSGRLRP